MRWTNIALQENQSYSGMTNHKDQSSNTDFVPTNIGIPSEHSWSLFNTVRKRRNVSWYGSNAIIRSNEGHCIILCRSYEVGSKLYSQLLVLREVLPFGIQEKPGLIYSTTRMGYTGKFFQPLVIFFCTNQMHVIHFYHRCHPLLQKAQKLADKASTTRMSYNWP